MTRERVLMTVKTHPTLSRKYGETVCPAGVREDGTWMRIYPVPFRRLEENEQYKKFDWIETDFDRGGSDPRPETRHPADLAKMQPTGQMFDEDVLRETFKIIPKLPYAFSYQLEDADGRRSTLQVLDWECGQLFWNCLRRHGDEALALEKVKAKYWDEFGKRDLHFFLGTTQQFHGFAPNPWVIVGVFAPPHEHQLSFSDI